MHMPASWTAAGVGLLAALMLGGSGCEESCTAPGCPAESAAGVIRGRVTVGDMPFDGRVMARRVLPNYHYAHTTTTPIAADGSFHLALPRGRYGLAVEIGRTSSYGSFSSFSTLARYWRGPDGWVLSESLADTLVLDETRSVVDLSLTLGSLEVVVRASADLAARSLTLYPEHRDLPVPSWRETHWAWAKGETEGDSIVFRLPGFLPGACALQLGVRQEDWYGDGERFYLPGTRLSAQADSVTVRPGEITRYTIDLTAAPAAIEGRVLGAWQTMGLDRPELTLCSVDSLQIAAGRCGEDGTFRMSLWQPEPVKLRIGVDGSQTWLGGESFAEAEVLDPLAGEVTVVGDQIVSGLFLRLDAPGFSSLGDVRLVLHDSHTLERVRARPIYSIRGASIAWANVRPGDYRLFVDNFYLSMDCRSQWFDRAASAASSQIVTIPEGGGITELRITLEPGGVIQGSVQTADECPCAVVYVVDAQTGVCVGRTGSVPRPCREGCRCATPFHFTARGLPEGDFKVGAVVDASPYCEDPPPGTVWSPGTTTLEEAAIIQIRDQAVVTGVDIQMPQ